MNNYNLQRPISTLYDFDVMKCVNPDNLLFVKRLSNDAWEFFQITNLKLLDEFEGNPDELIMAYKTKSEVNGIDVVSELNRSVSIISFTVDLSCENAIAVDRYKTKLQKDYPNDWKYMACEDIFIRESTDSIIENVLKQDKHYYD